MSKVTIYGVSGSRAIRSIWMAEELKAELGIDYDHRPVHFFEESKTPDFLAVNPNGRVPAMDDDGFILFESLAINLYLAKKNPESALAPRGLKEDGLATQWSIWALTELENHFIALVVRHPNVAMFPPDEAVENAAPDLIFAGRDAARLPNTSCFAARGWKGETQVMAMDLAGIAISAGSACSSGKVRASRVLTAMGHDEETARSAIRVSLGLETTEEEVTRFAQAWASAYGKMRARAA